MHLINMQAQQAVRAFLHVCSFPVWPAIPFCHCVALRAWDHSVMRSVCADTMVICALIRSPFLCGSTITTGLLWWRHAWGVGVRGLWRAGIRSDGCESQRHTVTRRTRGMPRMVDHTWAWVKCVLAGQRFFDFGCCACGSCCCCCCCCCCCGVWWLACVACACVFPLWFVCGVGRVHLSIRTTCVHRSTCFFNRRTRLMAMGLVCSYVLQDWNRNTHGNRLCTQW
jgi:hypothetical protein